MISVRRGTTKEFVIALTDESGNEYKIDAADRILFGVKQSANAKDYVIAISVGNDAYMDTQSGYLITLLPEHTEKLPFGEYVYDAGLLKESGEFYPVCPCDTFEVATMVTERGMQNADN